ncbi:MAG TPA: glycoside hydrolase family 16 protein [Vicinamibacteria bacterium]|nr:glycoside hydrolase family 16 protein [Vicinamibacteria bacterium]
MLAHARLHAACALLLLAPAVACGGDSPAGTPAPAPTPTPGPAGWTLVFADEFETPGALDPAKWGYEVGYIRNNEKQYYTSRSENVRAEGGNLVIEARKEAYQGYGYTSASINTQGRFELLYGRVEVRAKLPTGNGTWPAIWMLGTNIGQVGWPACGEIDIMENVGFEPTRIYGTIHTGAYNHVLGTAKGSNITVSNPWEDFHVYAMEWFADHIDLSVDGQKYFSFRNEGTGATTWPFDKPQYLLINLAIGGEWGGQKGVDDSLFPHRYLVDYVRIYKQK